MACSNKYITRDDIHRPSRRPATRHHFLQNVLIYFESGILFQASINRDKHVVGSDTKYLVVADGWVGRDEPFVLDIFVVLPKPVVLAEPV